MRIKGGCASNVGNFRANNQDSIFFQCIEQKGNCFAVGAVCDGIGGMEHGEVASGLVVQGIRKWFRTVEGWLDLAQADPSVLFSHLKDGAESWNEDVRELCLREDIRMGTTLSLIMLVKNNYYILHVGDSRIYRYRNGSLQQLTVDDSVSRLKGGRVKNYLDNYVAKAEELRFQALEGAAETGDLFLCCSDGFYHHMTEEDIAGVCQSYRRKTNLDEVCDGLVHTMMDRGERDNVSLVAMMVEGKRGLLR